MISQSIAQAAREEKETKPRLSIYKLSNSSAPFHPPYVFFYHEWVSCAISPSISQRAQPRYFTSLAPQFIPTACVVSGQLSSGGGKRSRRNQTDSGYPLAWNAAVVCNALRFPSWFQGALSFSTRHLWGLTCTNQLHKQMLSWREPRSYLTPLYRKPPWQVRRVPSSREKMHTSHWNQVLPRRNWPKFSISKSLTHT